MDTPRTDAHLVENRSFLADGDFARQLETELILANQKLEAVSKFIGDKVALLSTHHLKEILGPSVAPGDPFKHQDSITL